MTYEGARSITGPFLYLPGASAGTVGLVSGLGEFTGYAPAGYSADRTRRYWLLTFLGYAVNLLSVPLLALAGRWEVAAAPVVLERTGKAIRTPARDTMLSYATRQVGRGWGFGVHEALDQLGAVSGPVLVSALLFFQKGYRTSSAVLAVPALLALSALTLACINFPAPRHLEAEGRTPNVRPHDGSHRRRLLWLHTWFTGLSVLGYAHFQLISYHHAGIADITPGGARGMAYGAFDTIYGGGLRSHVALLPEIRPAYPRPEQ